MLRSAILLILLALALGGCARAQGSADLQLADVTLCQPAGSGCRERPWWTANPQGRLILIRAEVRLARPPAPEQPLAVSVSALASSEVYWNGRLIGRNGRPAAVARDEAPGRIAAVFPVPSDLVSTGANRLEIVMSSHRGPVRYRNPVHGVRVGNWAALVPSMGGYAPALGVLGALCLGVIYFGALWWRRREDHAPLLLAACFAAAAGQLAAEVLRAFVNYPYPLHAVRVMAIVGFAALFGLLLTAWCATRFPQRGGRAVVAAAALLTLAAVLLMQSYDIKASVAIALNAAAAAGLAWRARRLRMPGATLVAVGLTAFPVLALLSGRLFLDQVFYLAILALALVLFGSQALALRREEQARDAARLRTAELEVEALKRRLRRLVVNERGRREAVDLDEVVAVRGADDYAELVLADGSTRLLSESLTSLAGRLPEEFMRIHRSAIVDLRRVRELTRRPGGGEEVRLTDGATLPVGRSFVKQLRAALAPGKSPSPT